MPFPKLIDNKRVTLGDTLKNIAGSHKHLRIATGFWDLPGTMRIIDELKEYESIQLLIGQEPLLTGLKARSWDQTSEQATGFPERDISFDLTRIMDAQVENDRQIDKLRETARVMESLIQRGVLQVRVMKAPRLHAKAYIFGQSTSNDAVAIVGSSNFTEAGLMTNTELNTVESDYRVVTFIPQNESQENGYISWFDSLWNDPEVEVWTGVFSSILKESPVGDKVFGPYDVYIKTLMEVFPDELLPPEELSKDISDVLYSFQNRNAGLLVNKLNKKKLAVLSDSVGLGKTITAGAVIKNYLDKAKENGQKCNVQIIAPAALKSQWKDDLSSVLGIEHERDFSIVSQQDSHAIEEIVDHYNKEWRRTKNIDLFVIDEAHNLRTPTGSRHEIILRLLQQHPDSHILLLTATPINNSLLDISNQIQLAAKGKNYSVNVPYARSSDTEMIDFFEALRRIQSSMAIAERSLQGSGSDVLEQHKATIHHGLKHYLVRSTRQGVEAEGGIINKGEERKKFPTSNVESINYKYTDYITKRVSETINSEINGCFSGMDPRRLNLLLLGEITQQTSHPLDFVKDIIEHPTSITDFYGISADEVASLGNFYDEKIVLSLVPNFLQMVFLLGFTPYRPSMYDHRFYGKSIDEIRALADVSTNTKMQFSVHNMLQITWLKRLESSSYALLRSVRNYFERIELFEKYLKKGFIVSICDANTLENEYSGGADIEYAFAEFDKFLKEKEMLVESGSTAELKKHGVERIIADEKVFNLEQMKIDLVREKAILGTIDRALEEVVKAENDAKMKSLITYATEKIASGKYGKKMIVFSFFADTITYLQNNIHSIQPAISDDFLTKTEFLTGNSANASKIAQRFSPKSKKYTFKEGETEIDFLFATDVLSEGQNLQDAGFLVNYDLHWNPVRMIQRNGRINRLGSEFESVLISNMRPTDELEMYLKLVRRLEVKIRTIKTAIGLDQGVLSNSDINPIEFCEKYYETGVLPDLDDELLAQDDEHVTELRRFLALHKNNYDEITRVQEIPLGKWNYFPEANSRTDSALGLIRTIGITKKTNSPIEDLVFVDVSLRSSEYVATYLEPHKALARIKADESDNLISIDRISINRTLVAQRCKAEAKRQSSNPASSYSIKPRYLKALQLIQPYLDPQVSLIMTIKRGVDNLLVTRQLEKILRDVITEHNNLGVVTASTINAFIQLFNVIKENMSEEKLILSTEGVLFYANK